MTSDRSSTETGRAWGVREWVGRRSRLSPQTTAAIDTRTGQEWTYADLDESVDETAAQLQALGIGPRDHLGILGGTTMGTLAVVHAAARIGAVLVPLHARSTAAAVARALDRADVEALVCPDNTTSLGRAAIEAADATPPVATLGSRTDRLGSLQGVAATGEVDPYQWSISDPQLIPFTSGTTADPKPVVLTAGNLLAAAIGSAFRLGVSPDDRWLCELPAYHMGGIAPFYRSALYGTTVVLQERETDGGFDPDRTLQNCVAYRATGISVVPTQLDRMLSVTSGRLAESLRVVLLGGGPAPTELIDRCTRRGVPVHPTYGMTETASQIATARPDEAAAHPTTVGAPLVVTDLSVVDDEGESLPAGDVGEFVVGGPTVTPGYYDDPAATADAIGEHGLHTGDRGYLDEAGRAYVRGRRDDRIVTGGENVSPTAVEDALVDIDGVTAAAVVGIEDSEWGERVAALVVRDDPGLTADTVLDALTGRLADFERPQSVTFAEGLPRTVSGTIDRAAVRDLVRVDSED